MKVNSLEHLYELVGNKLAELRKIKGYQTVKEFAAAFKLAPIQYWRIENGKTNPTLASLYKVLKIHKISVLDFFTQIAGKEKDVKQAGRLNL